MSRQRSLQDTVVVVTGAGGGIGGQIARLVLAEGGRVVAGDLRPESLTPLREEFGADKLVVAHGDVRDEATAVALVAAGVAAVGPRETRVAHPAKRG